MSKDKISDYSATANSNTDIAGINIDEGCAPSGINDAIRTLMKQLKDFQQGTNGDSFNGPHNGTVGATTPAAGTFTSVTTPIVGSASGASLALKTNGGTTAVTIDTSQNVGIGTSSPQNLLNVVKNSANSSAAANAGIALQSDSGATYTAGLHFGTDKASSLSYIQSDSSSSYSAVPLVINPLGGSVGIGTSSPSYKLDVRGAISAGDGTIKSVMSYDASTAISGTLSNHPYAIYVNSSERMRIDSSGNLLVGTTTYGSGPANAKLVVRKTSTGQGDNVIECGHAFTSNAYQITFWNPNGLIGSIQTNGSSTAYVTSSDYRLKENVQPMQNALEKVAQLNPVTFSWKVDGSDGQGFIAHELQAVVPECVTGEKDAVDADGKPVYQGIDTSFLVATLTAAIQELKAELDAAKADIAALKGTA